MPDIMFNGPEGRLEGRYHQSRRGAPLALVLHPHPLHGGTMNNRITFTLYKTFVDLGFSTLRFNFRGVGKSQGRPSGGMGEVFDAAVALDWLQTTNPDSTEIWVGGYSFGAFVGMQLLMRRPEITGWVSVAPPANDYDFTFLAPCPHGGLMIAGARDQLAPEPAIRKLVDRLNGQKNVEVDFCLFPEADHIFSSQGEEIAKAMQDHVRRRQKERRARPPILPASGRGRR